jgi:hypothetical protein
LYFIVQEPQGVEARVHPVVHLGEVGVVADEVHLADFGQGQVLPQELLGQVGGRNVQFRQGHGAPAGAGDFKD